MRNLALPIATTYNNKHRAVLVSTGNLAAIFSQPDFAFDGPQSVRELTSSTICFSSAGASSVSSVAHNPPFCCSNVYGCVPFVVGRQGIRASKRG